MGCLVVVVIGTSTSVVVAKSPFHALLIGNNAYEAGKLKNPINDVELLGTALRDLGFEVTIKTDLGHREMDDALFDFTQQVPKGGLAFFYFAGHGIGLQDDHFLIPVDARLRDSAALKYQAVSQDFVLDALNNSGANTKVLMMDCCRNNPFERSWHATQRNASSDWSPRTEAPDGTLIAYATAENQPALDGVGDNSPFAFNLSEKLRERPSSGLYLLDAIRSASEAVKLQTGQRAWVHFDSSMPRVCLTTSPYAETQVVAVTTQTAERPTDLKHGLPTLKPNRKKAGVESSLISQARMYLKQGDYDLAIEAYTMVVFDPEVSKSDRTAALRDRSSAYIRRGIGNDLERALIDAQAIGQPGIQLPHLAESSRMRIESQQTGTIYRHEIASITSASGDLFYVQSVYGAPDKHGWVEKTAFRRDQSTQVISVPKATQEPRVNSQNGKVASPVESSVVAAPIAQPASVSNFASISNSESVQLTSPISSTPSRFVQPMPVTPSYTSTNFRTPSVLNPYQSQSNRNSQSASSSMQPRYQLRNSSGGFAPRSGSGGRSGGGLGGGCPHCKLGRR